MIFPSANNLDPEEILSWVFDGWLVPIFPVMTTQTVGDVTSVATPKELSGFKRVILSQGLWIRFNSPRWESLTLDTGLALQGMVVTRRLGETPALSDPLLFYFPLQPPFVPDGSDFDFPIPLRFIVGGPASRSPVLPPGSPTVITLPGEPPKIIQLRATPSALEWRYVGDDFWIPLVPLEDLRGEPGLGLPTGGAPGEILAKLGSGDYQVGWAAAGGGDMNKLIYDPNGIEDSAFLLNNMTGSLDGGVFT